MVTRVILGIFSFAVSQLLMAGSFTPLSGHVKLQQQYAQNSSDSVAASLGETDISASTIDFRAIGEYQHEGWDFVAHYQLLGIKGNAVTLANELQALFPQLNIKREDTQWFDLSHSISSGEDYNLTHSLDRFYLGYSNEHLVLKLGRQALSWGNGLVFRPMDLFNPFAPDAIDTSYKPGTDMLYGQWLLDNGSDLSGLVVPRRNPQSGQLEQDQSSAALKWHHFGQTVQSDLMLSKDYVDTVLGLGMYGPVSDALWRLELVPSFLENGDIRTSLVVNFENAWQWNEKNVSGFVEYFYNGFGLSDSGYTLADLPDELSVRLARGQLFNTGQNYLTSGLRLEWTPLLQIVPLLIFNLDDYSGLIFLQGNYSMLQDVTIDFGITAGFGAKGTEYGGIETSPGSGIYFEPVNQVYARLAYFF